MSRPLVPAITSSGSENQAQAEFEKAITFHQEGKLDEAEAIYRSLLRQQPRHADALHFLGVAQGQRQNLIEAAALIAQSIEVDPGNAAAHSNFGNVLKGLQRNADALVSYDKALTFNGDNSEVLNSRGVVLLELGRPAEALNSFERALAASPDQVQALFNRGVALAALNRLEESLAGFDRVLAVKAEYAEALFNRGNVLVALARHEHAVESYDQAIAIRPDYVDALRKHGGTLMILRRFEEARASYERLLSLIPDDLDAFFNCGVALVERRKFADAVVYYDRALVVKSDYPEVLNNRGIALWWSRRYEEAIESYDRALVVRPDYADAHFNRGIVLAHLNRHADALISYDHAIASNPEYIKAFSNRGAVLGRLQRDEEALASYDRALELGPDFVDALNNRGGIFRKMGLHERAAQDYSRLLDLDREYEHAAGNKLYSDLWVCNWRQFHESRQVLFDAVQEGKLAGLPFQILVMSDSGADQLQCAQTYVARKYPATAKPLWSGERYRRDRIRVAYLSADFRDHATTQLMAELFEKHDAEKFEVSAWSFGPSVKDAMHERLQKSFEYFNDVRSKSDIEVAAMLRGGEIDIAVDLKGFTYGCRPSIFAQRAAPIQVNYLGYPGTTGADYMDYIIGDAEVIPVGHDAFYTEKVVRLPDTFQVNDSKRALSERALSRAEARLPESAFVFCCFNNNYKITPDVFDVWMRLLKRVEGSVLWLLEDNAAAARNLRLEAKSRGVQADRLVFAARVLPPDHLARHKLADLFLDTLPCNAHTTASDALWAGLPLLTCRGNAFPGRVAASLLRAIGLPELITDNLAAYEALALKLATTPSMLNELKAKLARNRDTYPLFDTDRFRRHIESAYVKMYERYQRGEPPESFSVTRIDAGEK